MDHADSAVSAEVDLKPILSMLNDILDDKDDAHDHWSLCKPPGRPQLQVFAKWLSHAGVGWRKKRRWPIRSYRQNALLGPSRVDGMSGRGSDWAVLRESIGGEVVVEGEAGYEAVRRSQVARDLDSGPQAVVLVATADDVAETIMFARKSGLRISPRSGGHSLAGWSSTGDLIIDVSLMRSVSISDDVATVGAGTRLSELYDKLAVHGRTIPAGCGPSVGIAGLTLGGGLGILGRKYGLTCDHLLGVQIVLADGRIVECDENRHSELFWALRGAGGGNFGVVTSLMLATVPAESSTCFHLVWSPVHAAAVVDAWQVWGPTAPDTVDASLRLTTMAESGRRPVVNLLGAMLGTAIDVVPLLSEFVARVGADPATEFSQSMSYRDVKRHLSGLGSADAHTGKDVPQLRLTFSKSEFFRQPLPKDAIIEVLDNLTRDSGPGQSRELNLTPWGGAYNRVSSDATAFVHRNELFMIEHLVMVDPAAQSTEVDAARAWLQRSWASVHQWGSGGVYPNFPDPDLEDWANAYYGANLGRLLRVKQKYDPDNWFRFPQSLGN